MWTKVVVAGRWLALGLVASGAVWGLASAQQPPEPAPSTVGVLDIRVRVFNGEPAEIPLDFQAKLHVVCDARRKNLIFIYERVVTVLKGGCEDIRVPTATKSSTPTSTKK